MLAHRLRKNRRLLRKWAAAHSVTCYRLYEKDIPEYPLLVDWYDGRALVYAMNRKRDETEEARRAWLADVEAQVLDGLDLTPERLWFKQRERQRGAAQYTKLDDRRYEFIVEEGGHRFWVNLSDYHDTGLFLDHRPLRATVQAEARGKRFLNLFCYTGAFTVYAARGGAAVTVSVDLSNTYLRWAERNFALNELSCDAHATIRADVTRWLPRAARRSTRFDLIVCDPPTFSNSKAMPGVFDVNADHAPLIDGCLRLLNEGGTLWFSTNKRGFRLSDEARDLAPCEEITEATIPRDYRNRTIHRCWRFTRP